MHSTDIDKKSAKAEIVIRMTASKKLQIHDVNVE